ncbi:hypothetical protein ACHAWF_012065 [Thalassiosira exigua]
MNSVSVSPNVPNAHAPFSSSLPLPRHQHHRSKRRHHPSDGKDKPYVLSASIPLPKSHIQRTNSELQLADDLRRAEYEDVRMYARLVVGMQSRCVATGYVHPLTQKSLQDILHTRQAGEEELERLHVHDEDDDGWELSYDRDAQDENSVDSPMPKTPSSGSMASNLSGVPQENRQEEEDECMFSLEL